MPSELALVCSVQYARLIFDSPTVKESTIIEGLESGMAEKFVTRR